jgi:hypothetical protein
MRARREDPIRLETRVEAAEVSPELVAAGLDEVEEPDEPDAACVEDEAAALVFEVLLDASATVPPAAMGVERRSS